MQQTSKQNKVFAMVDNAVQRLSNAFVGEPGSLLEFSNSFLRAKMNALLQNITPPLF